MSQENPKPIATIKSGNVYVSLFMRTGDFGPYLEPGRPAHRYKDKEGKVRFSEYMRDYHCLHLANCYGRAHQFIESWKANKMNGPYQDTTDLAVVELPDVHH